MDDAVSAMPQLCTSLCRMMRESTLFMLHATALSPWRMHFVYLLRDFLERLLDWRKCERRRREF